MVEQAEHQKLTDDQIRDKLLMLEERSYQLIQEIDKYKKNIDAILTELMRHFFPERFLTMTLGELSQQHMEHHLQDFKLGSQNTGDILKMKRYPEISE